MRQKLHFPRIEAIRIRKLSIYQKDGSPSDIEEFLRGGAYCLAGANGLGKTTFLNAINFGLTGIVLQPDKEVFSPSEIFQDNYRYTQRYFSGRISPSDENEAQIELVLLVDRWRFRIVRRFGETGKLRLLEIVTIDGEQVLFKDAVSNNEDGSKFDKLYRELLAEKIGLPDFYAFAFLQLYVFTFDESRRMVFWDSRASSFTLSLVFNSSPDDAKKVADLTRQMEKHESDGRNTRWQATQMKNKLEELLKTQQGENQEIDPILEEDFRRIEERITSLESTVSNLKLENDTLRKNQSYLNSNFLQLRTSHRKLFDRYSKPRVKLLENAIVKSAIDQSKCFVCGATGLTVVELINRNIRRDHCPICETSITEELNSEDQDVLMKAIEENDRLIFENNKALEVVTLEIERKEIEIESVETELRSTHNSHKKILEQYPSIASSKTTSTPVRLLAEQYENQYRQFDLESRAHYQKRDDLRPAFNDLMKKVERAYKEGEEHFVPSFKELAKRFIGFDLDIYLQKESKGIRLHMNLRGSPRTEAFQLSESQRFFLDIALRMTIGIYLAKSGTGSTLLIDTPEGSLDIAYESRVGRMFGDFVTKFKQNMILTMNINASQLPISLANVCGSENMQFRRMLDWTDLSEIQKEGEELFSIVFSNINSALKKL